jgi:predicted dehydrogenase
MPVSRRQFLATTATAAASVTLLKSSSVFAAGVSDIRIATIGVRGRGQSHLDAFPKNVVAICDVDENVLNDKASKFEDKNGRKVQRVTDFRKLLDDKNIDAVTIATPNHTHALIAVLAAQAGKDVYCEKPIAQTIWESRQVVQAARKYDRIIQCGTQARSSESIKSAVEFIRSGELGPIRYAMGTCYKPRPSIGKSETPFKFPSTIDKDLWLGPASDEAFYRPEKNSQGGFNPHYDWHWDFNTGNGDMGNQGIHQMDVARWFLGVDTLAPRVLSIGGRLGYEDAGNTPNTQVAYFDYPEAPLIFETRGLPHSKLGQKRWDRSMDNYRGVQIGVIVQCEKGYVAVGSNYTDCFAYDNQGKQIKGWQNRGLPHFENWLNAVAAHNSSLLNAEIHEGHLSSSLCFMGSISHRLGEKKRADEIAEVVAGRELLANSFDRMASHLRANEVDIDGEAALTLGASIELDTASEMFVGNDAANELRTRKQRAPFIVPDLETQGAATTTG